MINVRSLFGGDGLKARSARGSVFTIASFVVENVLRLGGNLVLTRLLFPEAFGIMALVNVVITGLVMFTDLGLRSAIIQDTRGDDPKFLNVAWTIQGGVGFLIWMTATAFAVPVANFYGEPLLAAILPVAGLSAVFSGLSSTRFSTASRHVAVGRMTFLSLVAQTLGIVLTMLLAFWLQSVWALVIGALSGPFIKMILSHTAMPGHPNQPAFEGDAARRLMTFGVWIFLASIAGFLINHGDRAILGRFVSLTDLALYNIGFFLASVPILLARNLNQAIIFPLYARRPPAEKPENRRKIAQARMALTAVTISLTLGLALIGNWLVILLYDIRYEGAGPLMVLIAIGQLPAVIMATYDSLALATGNSRAFAGLVISQAVIRTTTLILMTSSFGAVGAALAPLPAMLLYYPILLLLIRRYKGWDPLHDALYFTIATAGAVFVIWWNAPVLGPVLQAAMQ